RSLRRVGHSNEAADHDAVGEHVVMRGRKKRGWRGRSEQRDASSCASCRSPIRFALRRGQGYKFPAAKIPSYPPPPPAACCYDTIVCLTVRPVYRRRPLLFLNGAPPSQRCFSALPA